MRNKAFRNPHILSKLVDFVSVDESGSNLGEAAWERKAMMRDGNAKVLAERQQQREDQRNSSQASGKRSAIPFATSSDAVPSSAGRERDRDKGKGRDERDRQPSSRWDRDRGRNRSRSPPRRRQ